MLRHLAGRALRQLGGGFSRLATPLQTASAVTAVASSHQLQLVKLLQGSAASWHGGGSSGPDEETIAVTFVEKDEEKTIRVPLGQSLLEAAHQNNIELEDYAIPAQNQEYYDILDEPEDDELDMLDLAFGLTETSRLGCQILARKDLDGIKVKIPSATRNFAVDGFKPKPH